MSMHNCEIVTFFLGFNLFDLLESVNTHQLNCKELRMSEYTQDPNPQMRAYFLLFRDSLEKEDLELSICIALEVNV